MSYLAFYVCGKFVKFTKKLRIWDVRIKLMDFFVMLLRVIVYLVSIFITIKVWFSIFIDCDAQHTTIVHFKWLNRKLIFIFSFAIISSIEMLFFHDCYFRHSSWEWKVWLNTQKWFVIREAESFHLQLVQYQLASNQNKRKFKWFTFFLILSKCLVCLATKFFYSTFRFYSLDLFIFNRIQNSVHGEYQHPAKHRH